MTLKFYPNCWVAALLAIQILNNCERSNPNMIYNQERTVNFQIHTSLRFKNCPYRKLLIFRQFFKFQGRNNYLGPYRGSVIID